MLKQKLENEWIYDFLDIDLDGANLIKQHIVRTKRHSHQI